MTKRVGWVVALLAACVLWASPAAAQTRYFTQDCSGGAPCNFTSDYNGNGSLYGYYSTSVVAAACPSGNAAVRIQYNAGATITTPQFYQGYALNSIGTTAVQGNTYYFRGRSKFTNTDVNGSDVKGGPFGKFLIVGDAGGAQGRVIHNNRDGGGSWLTQAWQTQRNVDGDTHGTGNLAITNDAYNNWQVRVDTSSSVKAVSSITRSTNTATVTTSTAHGFSNGASIEIGGAVEGDYNGLYTITVTGANTFTYTVSNSPTTPATGTIEALTPDARIRVYLGAANATTGSPTGDSNGDAGFGISVSGWSGGDTVKVGGYVELGQAAIWSPAPQVEFCDVVFADYHDTAWNDNLPPGGGGGGSTKYRFRFRAGGDELLMVLALSSAVTVLVGRVRRARGGR